MGNEAHFSESIKMKYSPNLKYRLDSTTIFSPSALIVEKNSIGEFVLSDDILEVSLSNYKQSFEEAIELLEPILRSWRLEAEITNHAAGTFEFKFYNASFPNKADDIIKQRIEELKYEKDTKSELLIEVTAYPPYPITKFNEEMEIAWTRYKRASMGLGESIPSAAYFILTLLTNTIKKGLKDTANVISIDSKILKKLGELSSIRGDISSSRKYLGADSSRLSNSERNWISQAVRICLFHLGKHNNGISNDKVNFGELVNLNSS